MTNHELREGEGYIYALCDPQTGETRYVGQTTLSLKWRLYHHVDKAHKRQGRGRRFTWMRSLPCDPIIVPLEIVKVDELNDRERHWIAFYREHGVDLVNGTDGGDGIRGWKHSDEAKAKIAVGQRGRVRSQETRARMSEARRRDHGNWPRVLSDETRAKLSASASRLDRVDRTPVACDCGRGPFMGMKGLRIHMTQVHEVG